MKTSYKIQSYCHIRDNTVSLNGNILFNDTSDDFPSFIKASYKHLNTNYPKFFKMDNLSKLAFLTADVILKEFNFTGATENEFALVFSNHASSLDTDRKHQESIQNYEEYFPSPAVFVYTLPNICMGEISIRHTLFSENSFFIFDAFQAAPLYVYANSLLNDQKAEKVLCGWVNVDENNYDGFLYLVSKEGNIEHSVEEITRLYNKL